MMKHTATYKKTLYRAFLGFLCAFILISGINFDIPETNASNVYSSDISFYQSGGDLFIKFFVNTSFSQYNFGQFNNLQPTLVFSTYCMPIASYISPEPTCDVYSGSYKTCHFVAGNTYTINTKGLYRSGGTWCLDYNRYVLTYGTPDETHFFKYGNYITGGDTEQYFFTETPTLSISYPFENAEISQAFDITGSYSIPANSGIEKLVAFFYGDGLPYAWYSFHQDLTYLAGAVSIRSSGIQASDYTIKFCFVGSGIEATCLADQNIDISIVDRIPPELPETFETPPEFYDGIDADQFYIDFSDYATPTAMFITLKSAIQPIFTTIGSNLTFFTSRFDGELAKETGEKTGEAILLIRSYSSNLNTFFNDLPVSEFLLFYLTLLIVVIVFRIIKNLINLIKP